jgi:alcohol dehydrogenase class IV
MVPFQFHTTPYIHFQLGSSHSVAQLAGSMLGSRVLFVTDPGLQKLGLHERAIRHLEAEGIHVTLFADVEADPSRETLECAVALGRLKQVTAVLGFGGGSSLDVAKLVALLLGSGEDLDAAWGVGQAKGPRLPLVLVPTTAGTGSEVTPVSIITIGNGEKRGVSSPLLLPDMAILDADLTLTLPSPVTATTGIDAMVHAIEAYTSTSANNNPMSQSLALHALRLLAANIETVVRDGTDRNAREAMLLGSMLAGQAFANSPVAAVHALAYPLGGHFHIPHGLSNALILPHVLDFNLTVSHVSYAAIAPHVFLNLGAIENELARAKAFVVEMAALSRRVDLPWRLRDVGIPEGALPRLADDAMKQTRLLVNNPRPITRADALAIYTAAW